MRVDPELRRAAEQILQDGESLSSFVEQRQFKREFIARGLQSRDEARRSGVYVSSDAVIGRLEEVLASKRETEDSADSADLAKAPK